MTVIVDPIKSLQLLVDEEIASLPLGEYPMLSRLQKRVISQKQIKWNVNTGGAGVTGEATTANVSTYSEDSVVGAQLAIGANRLRHSFQLQKEDIAEAATAGRGALRDLFGYEIQSGARAIMESLSGHIYTGTGIAAHGGVVGLGNVVATGVYADIDPATYPNWSAVLQTNGTNRPLTLKLLVDLEAAMARKGAAFTAVYTTPEIVARYKEVFSANLGITNTLPAGQADLGYSGLAYAGRPIIQDPYCPNNTLYFVNEPQVTLFTFGQNNTSAQQNMQFAIEKLPSANPDAENYVIYTKPQLKVHNRAKGVAALGALTQ
jgi:hypothetical protein